MLRILCRHLPGTALEEATFARRGFFPRESMTQQWLEQIARTFLLGYHASLRHNSNHLPGHLNSFDPALRGFAFEGAAMGLALLDLLASRPLTKGHWQTFMVGVGAPHHYMGYVGLGWALASLQPLSRLLGRPVEYYLKSLHPVLRWLVLDGYGFHAGYFQWPNSIERCEIPKQFNGYSLRAFDQGLGRSLWFVRCADPDMIAATIESFPKGRHADLWSGVGLACAYAGGVSESAIWKLWQCAAFHRPDLAQGVVFAATARECAGNPTRHTQIACELLCGLNVAEAARLADVAFENLPSDSQEPAYEVWRERIQSHFVAHQESTAYSATGALGGLVSTLTGHEHRKSHAISQGRNHG
jgi:hypothetical protein